MSEAENLKKPNSFPLEGLLAKGAELHYENVFSTRHLGRTVDYVLHQCGDFLRESSRARGLASGQAELRLRQVFHHTVFYAFRDYKSDENSKCVQLEFGWDKSRFILQVSFPSAVDQVAEIKKIEELADGVVVRKNPETGELYLTVFFNVDQGGEVPSNVIPLFDSAKKSPPKPLYDGDMKSFSQSEQKEGSNLELKIKAEVDKPQDESLMKVISNPLGALMNSLKKVKSLAKIATAANAPTLPDPGINEPQTVVAERKVEENKDLLVVKNDIINENLDNAFDTISSNLSSIAPELSKEQQDALIAQMRQSLFKNFKDVVDQMLHMQGIQSLAREKHFKKTLTELSARIETLKAEREYGSKDGAPGGVRGESATGLAAGIPKDPSQFESYVKKIEHDFKTKQGKFEERITRLTSEVSQKEVALNKMRDALNQKIAAFNKEKETSVDKNEFERRMAESRKTLLMSEERLKKAEDRYGEMMKKYSEEVRVRATAQQDLSRQKQNADLWEKKALELEAQLDGKNAQVRGLENQLKGLPPGTAPEPATASAGLGKKPAAGQAAAGDAQLKHKLDQANKLVRSLKEELAKNRKKFDELKLEESNLKVQLSKLQDQLAGKNQPVNKPKPK